MLKGVVRNLLGDAPLGDGSRFQEAKTRSKGPRDVEQLRQVTIGLSGCRDISTYNIYNSRRALLLYHLCPNLGTKLFQNEKTNNFCLAPFQTLDP